MKKLLFLAAMLLMVGGASAQKKADSKTVYIIDGKVVTEQEFKAIPSGKIKNMNVMKGAKSVVVASTEDVKEEANEMIITGFSKEGKQSVHIASSDSRDVELEISSILAEKDKNLEILKKNKVEGASMVIVSPKLKSEKDLKRMGGTIHTTHTNVTNGDITNVTITSNSDGNKLMLNDKVPVMIVYGADGKSRKIKDISEIDASKIESMTVLKQEPAKKIYGNQYGDLKDGIIVINLRNTEDNVTPQQRAEKIITVRGDNQVGESLLDESREPALYLGDKNPTLLLTDANGKTSIVESFSNVKIDDIESFEVIKDEKRKAEYEKKYGPSKDGFVHIVLKRLK
ncbi:MAG: hypothetical protein IKA96_03490 [Alistipes sp.]|nr:hypothetical protein [Alistipes sp.]MBR7097639.1 hypothetical protein [Alistipes sp.]